jgi:hypothetical protein
MILAGKIIEARGIKPKKKYLKGYSHRKSCFAFIIFRVTVLPTGLGHSEKIILDYLLCIYSNPDTV